MVCLDAWPDRRRGAAGNLSGRYASLGCDDPVNRAPGCRTTARDGERSDDDVPVTPLFVGRRVGAGEAIGQLFGAQYATLLRLAVLLVDDRALAEDLVQDAFLGLHRRWRFLRDDGAAIGYLRTAVVNGSRSALRRRRTARAYVPPVTRSVPSAEGSAMVAAEHAAVLTAVRVLPRRQREVVVLRYWLELSEREIAAALGIAPGSVKAYASRALDSLTRRLEDQS